MSRATKAQKIRDLIHSAREAVFKVLDTLEDMPEREQDRYEELYEPLQQSLTLLRKAAQGALTVRDKAMFSEEGQQEADTPEEAERKIKASQEDGPHGKKGTLGEHVPDPSPTALARIEKLANVAQGLPEGSPRRKRLEAKIRKLRGD